MIDVILFSVAGKKERGSVSAILEELLTLDYIPKQEKDIIKHTLEVASHGNYPNKSYFLQLYEDEGLAYNNTSELISYTKKAKAFYKKEWINRQMVKLMNESESDKETIEGLHKLLTNTETSTDEAINDVYRPVLYSESLQRPHSEGILLGISEIDQLTNGIQPGTVASFAAFVAEGKSTVVLSTLYKNARAKKGCILFSLEMSPSIVWAMIQARYMYEEKGMEITTQDLIFKKLTDEKAKIVKEAEEDFMRDIGSYLVIVDEAILSKQIMGDYKQISRLVAKIEKDLGSVELTAWDHVGQLELMYPDMGNQCVRNITSFTKTFINSKGTNPATLMAVQTNREGRKRAARKGGAYDLQAISDLNEVERSSTYCIFLFTSDDSKIVQETKVSMLKHRLGAVLPDPATVPFNPAILTVGSNVESVNVDMADFSDILGSTFDDMGF